MCVGPAGESCDSFGVASEEGQPGDIRSPPRPGDRGPLNSRDPGADTRTIEAGSEAEEDACTGVAGAAHGADAEAGTRMTSGASGNNPKVDSGGSGFSAAKELAGTEVCK